MEDARSTKTVHGQPFESRNKSLKNSARRRAAHGETAIKIVHIVPLHAQQRIVTGMNWNIRKADLTSVLAIKQPAPVCLMIDMAIVRNKIINR